MTQFSYSHAGIDLSLFSLMLNTAYTPFAIEMLVFIPVTYITICVMHSLFSIRIFSYYRFVPGGATNSRTLLMSASYMGRLVPPLVFNYMLMIHCGSQADTSMLRYSAYMGLMGTMKAFPIMGDAFAVFFPMVLIILVAMVLFNLGDRVLALFRVRQFQFDDHFDDAAIAQGERILLAEREALLRQVDMTDEEELEAELTMGLVSSASNPSVVVESLSASLAAGNGDGGGGGGAGASSIGGSAPLPPPRKNRLPRANAGLLRSLSEVGGGASESSSVGGGDDDAFSSVNASLIPRGGAVGSTSSIGSAGVDKGNSNNNGGGSNLRNSVLDNILDI